MLRQHAEHGETMRWLKEGQKQENGDIMVVGEPSILHSAAGHYVGQLYLHFYKDMRPDEQGIPMPYDRLSEYFPNEESAAPLLESIRKENADNQDDYYPEGYTPSSPTITNTAKKPIPAIS
ncbi:hypothetical protein [Thiolapillus sp.]|uniref:hypothetical protein n=4 Tax=Thiolapillus sp. TaxID=2017437 RepID=UPI003AF41C51